MAYRPGLLMLFLAGCGSGTTIPHGPAVDADRPLPADAAIEASAPDLLPDMEAPPAATDLAGVPAAAGDAADAPAETAPDGAAVLPDPGKARLAAKPAKVEYYVAVGCTATTKVRVSNTGNAPSGPLVVTTTAPFSIGADSCRDMALWPGGGCDVEVQLRPSTIGSATGTLKVVAGDASVTVPLLGGGLGSGQPFQVTQDLDLGAVRLGHTISLKAQVQNTRLDGGSIQVTSSVTGPDFTITGDSCKEATVKPGDRCAVEVAFTPTAAGARLGTLRVDAPGACGGGPTSVTLSGIGVTPPAGPLLIEPAGVGGSISALGCWTLTSVRVSNSGTAATAPLAVSLAGDEFSLETDGCTGQPLPVGGTCHLVVRFQAKTVFGDHQGTLTVAAAGAMDQIPLRGIGASRGHTLSSDVLSLHFGSVSSGTTSQKQRVLFSAWRVEEISGIIAKVVGDEFEIVEDQCKGAVLKAGVSCAVDLVFKPQSHSHRTGTLIATMPVKQCVPEELHVDLDGDGR